MKAGSNLMQGGLNKGIILAGGSGTRLSPATNVACKQLLPIYDKPMVYYPLSTLMLLGIKDVLIISTPHDLPRFEDLLGDGSHLGIRISYKEQDKPEGIAQAFLIGAEFIGSGSVSLILGDNVFYGNFDFLREARSFQSGATVFGYFVRDPERYGVVSFDSAGKAVSIEEKPINPESNYAVTGLYLYDNSVIEIARSLRKSKRGELEITDVNRAYLERGELTVVRMGRGVAWLDTGTHDSLLDAGNFIATIEKRQGQKIGCIEEIAFRMRFIGMEEMRSLTGGMPDNSYRDYLLELLEETATSAV